MGILPLVVPRVGVLSCVVFFFVEGIVVPFGSHVVSFCGAFVVSTCGVLVVVVSIVHNILLCGLFLGKLSFSPYDRDQTQEV